MVALLPLYLPLEMDVNPLFIGFCRLTSQNFSAVDIDFKNNFKITT